MRLKLKLKQMLCRHKYADVNMLIVEINHYTDTVRLCNYCVKCGKWYEGKVSYSRMFGGVLDEEIARRCSEKSGAE